MKAKIAGCVVLFHPDQKVSENIRTYMNSLDLLLLMDNSPGDNTWIKENLTCATGKLVYCSMVGNKGIANALNRAAGIALENGCSWLLTMDQDSHFKEGDCDKLVTGMIEAESLFGKPGIITPFQQVHSRFLQKSEAKFSVLRSAMTSGNLLNLQAWSDTGPFAEILFIDYVDHEYCLRLRSKGFHIIQMNQVQLVHSLGNFEVHRFLGRTIGVSNHNPDRRYYITRNGLYTAVKYLFFDWRVSWFIVNGLVTDFIRVVLFEKQKGRKLMAMLRGSWDAIRGRYGKLGSS
jgi:rhamnosyltransferase